MLFGFQQCGDGEAHSQSMPDDVEINDSGKKVMFHCLEHQMHINKSASWLFTRI